MCIRDSSNSARIYRVQSTFHEGEALTDDWATSSVGYGAAMQENLAGIEDYTRVGCIIQPEMCIRDRHSFLYLPIAR